MAKIRIQKALGDAGVLSRRKTEELIRAGKITVNGHRAQPGHAIDPAKDVITVEGERVVFPRRKENVYIMLNKPRGYVTTTSDELGRRCVTELVEGLEERVYPVGRLDKNTEGLLLLTNDGQFANLLMHPRSHVAKTYRLTVRPDINDDQLIKLSTGVQIDEDLVTLPASVIVLEKEPGRVVLQLTITEGKNRQIRRMCEAVGLEVARLKRVSVGPLKLGMLQPGQWRELKKSEVLALRNAGRPSEEPLEQMQEVREGRLRTSVRAQQSTGRDGSQKAARQDGSAPKYQKPARPGGPAPRAQKPAGQDGTAARYQKPARPGESAPRAQKPAGQNGSAPKYQKPARPGGPAPRAQKPAGQDGSAPKYQKPARPGGPAPRAQKPAGPDGSAPNYQKPVGQDAAGTRKPTTGKGPSKPRRSN